MLKDGEVETSLLDDAARRDVGVGGPSPLGVGRRGTRLRPGESGGSLADIGSRSGATDTRTGSVQKTKTPKGNVGVPPPAVIGVVSDAARVVAGMRGGFHACYRQALLVNPDARGHVQLVMTVAPNGSVSNATASLSGNLPGTVSGCVQRRAYAAQFSPPQGGQARVVVPITMIPGD